MPLAASPFSSASLLHQWGLDPVSRRCAGPSQLFFLTQLVFQLFHYLLYLVLIAAQKDFHRSAGLRSLATI
ncbi:hypothetical protein D3C76_1694830 [compost metagenome]